MDAKGKLREVYHEHWTAAQYGALRTIVKDNNYMVEPTQG